MDIDTVHGWPGRLCAGAPGYATVWNNPRRASIHVEAYEINGIAIAAEKLARNDQDIYLGACALHQRPANRGGSTNVGDSSRSGLPRRDEFGNGLIRYRRPHSGGDDVQAWLDAQVEPDRRRANGSA